LGDWAKYLSQFLKFNQPGIQPLIYCELGEAGKKTAAFYNAVDYNSNDKLISINYKVVTSAAATVTDYRG